MSKVWHNHQRFPIAWKYLCGYCNLNVAAHSGWWPDGFTPDTFRICICPNCANPTYFERNEKQIPGATFGDSVQHLPVGIDGLYSEARNCHSVAAYTAGAMACRKILMNVAVQQGAAENQKFFEYVNFLEAKGYVPPNGKEWVDHIRKKGNEAVHEIPATGRDDLEDLLVFLGMLLKFIYEFPKRVPPKTPK